MSIPDWADPKLSRDLPALRARGEGQEVEFKRSFPQQVSKLAKEIAAFATSNTGTILIGVEDNGDIVGLEGCDDALTRDELLKRLEGVCSGKIRPAVTPQINWAVESDLVVLVVTVPKGSEAVYYTEGKPYLRHITTSRPAEPHEVVELVKQHLVGHLEHAGTEHDEESSFYSELASVLHRILLWAETPARERGTNPWFEEWRADYHRAASDLRHLAAKEVAGRLSLDSRLREVADSLDKVVNVQSSLGSDHELNEAASEAADLASGLKRSTVDETPLSADSLKQVESLVIEEARRLSDLRQRAQKLVEAGRIGELQSDVGSIGDKLVELSFYDLSPLGGEFQHDLRDVGMRMRLIEVARVFMDGGASMMRIVGEVGHCADRLSEIAQEL